MRLSKVASLEANVKFSLSGVASLAPATDMTFSMLRKAAPDKTWVAANFVEEGTPYIVEADVNDLYAKTQMVPTINTTGAFTRAMIEILDPGKGYAKDNTFHLVCNSDKDTEQDGTPHDEVITVTEVYPDGGIKQFTCGGQGTAYTVGLAFGATTLTAPSATTTHTRAIFQINDLTGRITAAVISAIDVHADDATGTYTISVAPGAVGNGVAPADSAFTERKINTYGSIRAGHISTDTGTYTVGQVLAVMQTTDKGGRIKVLSIDADSDIQSWAIITRGAGYTVADNLELHTVDGDNVAVSDAGGRFDLTAIGDYTLSGGTVTFLADPTYAADETGPVYVAEIGPAAYVNNHTVVSTHRKPTAGDWLWDIDTISSSVQSVFDMTDYAPASLSRADCTDDATLVVSKSTDDGETWTPLDYDSTPDGADDYGGTTVDEITLGAAIDAGDQLRVDYKWAQADKVDITSLIDSTAHVPEVYSVYVDGTLKTDDTDYSIRGPVTGLTCTVPTATAAAGDVLALIDPAGIGHGCTFSITVDGSFDVATMTIITPGDHYHGGVANHTVTKVSGTGTVHDAIRITPTVAVANDIVFLTDKYPVEDAVVEVFVKSNALVCVNGDEIEYLYGSGGYQYSHIIPTADVVCAVSYE